MSISTANVEGLGEVRIKRARGVRSIRLRVDAHGTVQLTLPWWVAKSTGVTFLKNHQSWIEEQQRQYYFTVRDGMSLYDGSTILITKTDSQRSSSKIQDGVVTLNIPNNSDDAQAKLKQMLTKIIKGRAEEVLSRTLDELAEQNNFSYKSVKVRSLKARWGSCNEKKEITLNIYLVQLPVELIEYVLLHELTHTKHLHHGKEFWSDLIRVCPKAKQLKKELKKYQPRLYEQSELNT